MQQITFLPEFRTWQRAARGALQRDLPPEQIAWEELAPDAPSLPLFQEAEVNDGSVSRFRVPKNFLELAQQVALHSDAQRWALLYRILWRLTHGEPKLLEVFVDADVSRASEMAKSVGNDIHKMRAFVRFREVAREDGPWYVAWFEPQHHIVEHNAPFFIDRFAGMRWSILTPDRCANWDGKELTITSGVDRSQAPHEDEMESLWRTYYANIFNPARVKMHAMQAEMPKKYWRNLPETTLVPSLLSEAPRRVEEMIKRSSDGIIAQEGDDVWMRAPAPATTSLRELIAVAKGCTACPLYKNATQTVFGEGPKTARMMLVGEQPGDYEDVKGKPFVGPAGKLLDRALEEAGINREEVYVTNAVKHFKWEPRGKRRIHQKPSSRDIAACRPWLEGELRAVKPHVLVCLGATAAQTILGPQFRVTKQRGEVMQSEFSAKTVATVHPSSLLRAPDEETRAREYAKFVDDLRVALKAADGRK